MQARNVPVLIVGAGPAGLTTAIMLARHGVKSLVVERRANLSSLPRATAISTRTMELIRSWGLEPAVRAGEAEVSWDGWLTETLAAAADGMPFPLGYPSREQAAVVSPTAPACVPQDHLEPVLLDHLRSLGRSDVAFGTELVDLRQDARGVRAILRDKATGSSIDVSAQYLVAADGAHSKGRALLGIPMHGPINLVEHFTVLFRAPLWDVVGAHRHGLYAVTQPEAPAIFVPSGSGDRWLYGQEWQPGQDHLADYTERRLIDLIRIGAGVPDLQPRIERVGAFSFAAQLAERYREGGVFLVGDAAHRVTPRGGTGMNTAIHDGHNLGWKLAWVLRGWAAPALLDSYETERRPIGEHNTARSADPNGSVREVGEVLAADLAGRIPHLWLPAPGGRVSTLDVVGDGLTLFTAAGEAAWRAAAVRIGAPVPIDVRAVDPVTAAALGVRGSGALLVRPDGLPAALWQSGVEPARALRDAVHGLLGKPVRAATALAGQ